MGSILRLDLTYHKVIFFKSPLKVSDYKSLYQYEGLYMTFYKPHPLFFFFKKKVKTVTHRVIVEWENYLPDSHILSFFSHSKGTWRPGVLDRGGKPRPLVLMRKKPGLGPWAA